MQRALVTILFLAISTWAFAQGGTIRGVVFDKDDGEPIIYTNVILQGTSIGSQTDDQGVYNISNVPAGTYILFCTQFGYDTSQISVTVKNNQIVSQKIFLKQKGIELANIDVTAQREEQKTETAVSMTKITTKDIDRIPP